MSLCVVSTGLADSGRSFVFVGLRVFCACVCVCCNLLWPSFLFCWRKCPCICSFRWTFSPMFLSNRAKNLLSDCVVIASVRHRVAVLALHCFLCRTSRIFQSLSLFLVLQHFDCIVFCVCREPNFIFGCVTAHQRSLSCRLFSSSHNSVSGKYVHTSVMSPLACGEPKLLCVIVS